MAYTNATRVRNGLELDFVLDAADTGADQFLGVNADGEVTVFSSIPASRVGSGGNLTETTSSVLTITGGTGAVLAGVTIQVKLAGAAQSGYLSTTDWNTFNSKLGTTLTSAYVFVGNGSNVATGVAITGDIAITNAGVTSIASGVIVNADVNASAAIAFSKMAALTASRAMVTNGSGEIIPATTTATEIGYVNGVTSAIQTQLNTKLTVALSGLASGDIITYDGVDWVNTPVPGNTVPSGGSQYQIFRKASATNFDTEWHTLVAADLTDLTASATELNLLTGVTTTAAQFNYLNTTTGDVQSQLDSKIPKSLATGYVLVGVASIATSLAPGSNGDVFTISGGVPAWVTPGVGGTVTSVAASGGTTGLSFTGSPITTSGTLTVTGTLVAANGGTGQSSYTVGDILYASTTTALSKLAASTAGYVLTANGAGVAPSWQAVASGGHVIENSGTPLTARANLNFTNGLTASDNTPDTDVKLGGVITGDTYIYPDVDNTKTIVIGQDAGNSFTSTLVSLLANEVFIQAYSAANTINVSGTGSYWAHSTGVWQLQDSRAGAAAVGIQYFADYSANYTSRSLIDKGYADGAYWSLASGGTLTGANTITGTGQTLKGVWDSLGVTSTDGYGLWLANTTAAAAGAQQISPSFVWEGQGWKTNATAASQSVKYGAWVLPVEGASNPTANWLLKYSINGAAYVDALAYDQSLGGGTLTVYSTGADLQLNGDGITMYGSAAYILGVGGSMSVQGSNAAEIRTSDAGSSSGSVSIFSGNAAGGSSGNIYLYPGTATTTQGNIGLFTSSTDFDGGAKVLRLGARGTAPSGTIVADHAYLYVEDIAAGNAALHTMSENGDIIKLYSVGGWGTPTNTFDRTTFDTTTVTLPQLASRVGALISDLKTLHGLLKA